MADKTVEQLSVLLDNEGEVAQWDLALRRLSKDARLAECWQRYQLISDTLRNNLPETVDTGFAARVRTAVEAEAVAEQPKRAARSVSSWAKPAAGFAVAASVAALALFSLDTVNTAAPPVVTPPPLAATPAEPRVEPASMIRDERLDTYLVNHNGYASRNGVSGMLPYTRMVGYESKP